MGVVTRRGQTLLPTVQRLYEVLVQSLRDYAKSQGATLVKH